MVSQSFFRMHNSTRTLYPAAVMFVIFLSYKQTTKLSQSLSLSFFNFALVGNSDQGRECCDVENIHEIKLIWTIISRKHQLLSIDNRIIYVSQLSLKERQKGRLNLKWSSFVYLQLEITAFAAPPVRQQEAFRQFDLVLNKCTSFDHLSRHTCELGKELSQRTDGNDSHVHLTQIHTIASQ